MSASGSRKVVYTAVVVNFSIAIIKFIAAAYSGSSAMFSEGIHSVVDTGNQLLLLFGMKRAARPADSQHPFGYGMEIYFWAFVVAVLLFSLGAGVAIYEGIEQIRHPKPITHVELNYAVLLIAMVLEGYRLFVAWREFNVHRGGRSFMAELRRSKDPSVFTVLLEDSAALIGLMIALTGISLATLLDAPIYDGFASLGIGVMLSIIAAFLAYESKALLIGEAADPHIVSGIRAIAAQDKRIRHINELLTMHMGPTDLLVNLSIDFDDDYTAVEVEAAVSEMERRIKHDYPDVRRIFIETQSMADHLAYHTKSERRLVRDDDGPEENR